MSWLLGIWAAILLFSGFDDTPFGPKNEWEIVVGILLLIAAVVTYFFEES
jgi:hypothetical protein